MGAPPPDRSDPPPAGEATGSERRELRRRLEDESLQWFRTLAETSPSAIVVYRDRLLYVNPACEVLTGYRQSELLELDMETLVHPEDVELLRGRAERRLTGEPVPSRYQLRLVRRDGAVRWIDFAAAVIQYGGAPAGLGTAFDITEQHEALRRLADREERLRLAQGAAGIVSWDWDIRADRLVVADYGQEPFGLENLGSSADFARHVHPDDLAGFLGTVRELLRHGDSLTAEVRVCTPSGVRWALQRAELWRDAQGRGVRMIGVTVDITARRQAEEALRASEQMHRLLVEHQTDLVARFDARGVLDFVSPSFCRFFGVAEPDLLGRRAPFLGGDELRLVLDRLAPPPHTAHVELRTRSAGGGTRWLSWAFSAVLDAAGGAVRQVVAVARDVTERRLAEEALFEEKERAQVTLQSIGEAVVRTNAEGFVDYVNVAAERLTGWRLPEIYGQPLTDVVRLVDPVTEEPLADLPGAIDGDVLFGAPGEARLLDRHGERKEVQLSSAPLRDRGGAVRGAVLALQDLTSLRRMEDEVRHLERHDPLTGLLNRSGFEGSLREAAATARQGGGGVLLYLDLDTFKLVNDSCGHVAGDELLRRAAALIAETAGEATPVARLGPDEFALLVRGSREQARALAEELRGRFAALRFSWEDHVFAVSAAIGVVPLAEVGEPLREIWLAADAACEVAKAEGRGRVHEHLPSDLAVARHGEVQWVPRLQRAFDEGGFLLYCQPIRPLPSHPELATFCEVLLRLREPGGEIVTAGSFIPAAERYHLIDEVDRWVLRKTLETVAGAATPLALNVSGQSLGDETFLDFVLAQLDESGADPRRLLIEITETAAVANLSAARRLIAVLKGHGCRFVLDDFGSGMSSFAYLKNLPVDYLKIDGGFVRQLDQDRMRRVIVESIHQIGRTLGILTIAESVESATVHRELDRIGVDYAQGYWTGRPVPLGEKF